MRIRTIVAATVPAVCLLFAGCELFTGPDGIRVMGTIGADSSGVAELEGSPSRLLVDVSEHGGPAHASAPQDSGWFEPLEAPDTVVAGTPFEIIVRTAGANASWKADGAEVSRFPQVIEVTPFDRISRKRGADAVRVLPRTVELTFPEPGEAVLRLTGRIVVIGDSLVDERVGSYDYPIFVR